MQLLLGQPIDNVADVLQQPAQFSLIQGNFLIHWYLLCSLACKFWINRLMATSGVYRLLALDIEQDSSPGKVLFVHSKQAVSPQFGHQPDNVGIYIWVGK
jgi:hypothetical protein